MKNETFPLFPILDESSGRGLRRAGSSGPADASGEPLGLFKAEIQN